ncbi:MAG TPA: hypothetical protein VGW75_02125 [Solirubrobacteraceae bacterium]|jgi:hypothetical protein|nr:hypothetical protein [Solirubrobacteraceae bacterium]
MSEAEHPARRGREVTVDDVRQLMGASTPHFALQLRNRIAKLIRDLPPEHPARREGEREIRRLTDLGFTGEVRGTPHEDGIPPLPSLGADADEHRETPAGH